MGTNSQVVTEYAGCAESNGSKETITVCRFATANAMMMMASGIKTTAATNLPSNLEPPRDQGAASAPAA